MLIGCKEVGTERFDEFPKATQLAIESQDRHTSILQTTAELWFTEDQ